jgi:hypothetical protein
VPEGGQAGRYTPHLSFLYSDCEMSAREALAAELTPLVAAPARDTTMIKVIEVWDTPMGVPLSEWRLVHSVAFGQCA